MMEDAITVWLGVKEGNEHSREYVQGRRIYEWVMMSFFFLFFILRRMGENKALKLTTLPRIFIRVTSVSI